MKLFEKKLESREIFDGRIIKVKEDTVLLENGNTAGREVVCHSGGVCVAAVTGDKEIYFVRQFRYPYGAVLLEVPAGKLEKGEDPFIAAKRELLEETGLTAGKYIDLGKLYPSPAYLDEIIHMYAAFELSQGKQSLDDDEFLEIEKIPIDKAVQMILDGEVPDAKTQAAVLKLKAVMGI